MMKIHSSGVNGSLIPVLSVEDMNQTKVSDIIHSTTYTVWKARKRWIVVII